MSFPRLFRIVVAVTCTYETVAIVTKTHRLPTISRLSYDHPVFGAIVLGGLAHHFRTDAHGVIR